MSASDTPTSAAASAPALTHFGPGFEGTDFRRALGHFATGVTVITALAADGRPVGMTANSFNSVSLEPPLVLWSLAKRAGTFEAFMGCQHYAIHILTHEQQALSDRFAARGIDRFEGTAWQPGPHGLPLLEGVSARFVCAHRSRYDEGDHVIFVGEVLAFDRSEPVQPLMYHGGGYHLGWSPRTEKR